MGTRSAFISRISTYFFFYIKSTLESDEFVANKCKNNKTSERWKDFFSLYLRELTTLCFLRFFSNITADFKINVVNNDLNFLLALITMINQN
jgi:hypothetical protein